MVMTGPDKDLLRGELERELASRDFERFLDYVWIQETPQVLEGVAGGKTPFEKWPHVMEIAGGLVSERKLVILKARQLGASWVSAAYACWLFMFHPGAQVGMFSIGEEEAISLPGKVNFIYKNLPAGWVRELSADSRLEMRLAFDDGVESRIRAFPSTSKAGRGENFALTLLDEADYHDDLPGAYLALSGAVDSSGGQMVMISTVDPWTTESVFQQTYLRAKEGGTDWAPLFFGWRSRPTRDEGWHRRVMANTPTTARLSPAAYMMKEHPGSEDEPLTPVGAISGFDGDALAYMKGHIREPFLEEGPVRLYSKYQRGRSYACGTDTAHGRLSDFSVSCVLEITTQSAQLVACVMSNEMGTTEFAESTMRMLGMYGNPVWCIEKNDWGIDVVREAERARYRNLYTEPAAAEPGWLTTSRSRRVMWGNLRTEVNRVAVVIPDRAILEQFEQVIVVGDHGRMEARRGGHDDGPTAVALALQMEGYARASSRGALVRAPAAY